MLLYLYKYKKHCCQGDGIIGNCHIISGIVNLKEVQSIEARGMTSLYGFTDDFEYGTYNSQLKTAIMSSR